MVLFLCPPPQPQPLFVALLYLEFQYAFLFVPPTDGPPRAV